ncbi:OsmC family protein [Marinoscillum sp. MHG1-6]|uniref:OsmC family protein n=1 Tax=Marinoscillum sp. MHG1-6 TaxID=2959627 RepID=UPI0021585B7A|nr:OsmC family protein [Marinoscillum sp. MHG1-6]
MKTHHYKTEISWTGNLGKGTADYTSYKRDHVVTINGKSDPINMASDPAFRGDPTRYNPEELLVISLSSCHMLWYLHLCAINDIIVTTYEDAAEGTMEEISNGGGRFTSVTLHPKITIANVDKVDLAFSLHEKAHELCFIANSCNFPIHHQPNISIEDE